ncbi:MAG: phosphonates import ATP-binding protein PhnC 1 [Candidatus Tectimicrobiota bacterium]|nr:MAG: phosphonates import ATP-binding protein PhnC 1 [Candidatus Tectomicrobia bacterium]
MFVLEGVGKTFANGFVALRDLHLRIAPGERVALLGPSGAGKTTLLRLLNATLRPTAGRLTIAGLDSRHLHGKRLRQVRRTIGTIYQQYNLVPRLRVVHNVLAGHLGRWSGWRAALSLLHPLQLDTAVAALQHVGLADRLWQRTDQLSGGEQQRVAIARVLVQDPAVILADEPVASLDPGLAEGIVRLLVDLAVQRQKTLVVSLHHVPLARAYFPRLLALQQGRLVYDGPPQGLSAAAWQALFAEAPLPAAAERAHVRPVTAFPL